MKRVPSSALLAVTLGLVSVGCGPSYKSIEIEPRGNESSPMKAIGETAEFRAMGVGSNKIKVKLEDAVWSSSNEKVAKVDAKGKVTAVGSGRASLNAKWKELGDVVPVAVSVIATIEMQPAGPVTLKRGEETQFKAVVKNELGDVLGGGKCSWQLPGLIAVTNEEGQVRGREPGEAMVTARCMGKTTQAKIVVTKEEYRPPKK